MEKHEKLAYMWILAPEMFPKYDVILVWGLFLLCNAFLLVYVWYGPNEFVMQDHDDDDAQGEHVFCEVVDQLWLIVTQMLMIEGVWLAMIVVLALSMHVLL